MTHNLHLDVKGSLRELIDIINQLADKTVTCVFIERIDTGYEDNCKVPPEDCAAQSLSKEQLQLHNIIANRLAEDLKPIDYVSQIQAALKNSNVNINHGPTLGAWK